MTVAPPSQSLPHLQLFKMWTKAVARQASLKQALQMSFWAAMFYLQPMLVQQCSNNFFEMRIKFVSGWKWIVWSVGEWSYVSQMLFNSTMT